jgi:hypothetical protein
MLKLNSDIKHELFELKKGDGNGDGNFYPSITQWSPKNKNGDYTWKGQVNIRYDNVKEANEIAAFIKDCLKGYIKNNQVKLSKLITENKAIKKKNEELLFACKDALAFIEKVSEGRVVDAKDLLRLVIKHNSLKK